MRRGNDEKRAVLLNFHNGLLLLARGKLERYFEEIGNLNFRAATEVMTKKGDSSNSSSSQDVTKTKFWSELSLPLKLLSDCERVYYAIAYLDENTMREDTFKLMYQQLPLRLDKIIAAFGKLIKKIPQYAEELGGVISLLQQTKVLVECRLAVIGVYQSLAGAKRQPNFQDLSEYIEKLSRGFPHRLSHPWLASIQSNTVRELKLILLLFKTQLQLQEYNFKRAIMLLSLAGHALNSWTQKVIPTTGKQSSENREPPAMLVWLKKFYNATVGKSTLYFFNLLERHTLQAQQQMKAKSEYDFVSNIAAFVQSTQAKSFHLILNCSYDVTGTLPYDPTQVLEGVFAPPEQDQSEEADATKALRNGWGQGLSAWPAFFSHPKGPTPLEHWPNIISIITDRRELLAMGNTYYFVEELEDYSAVAAPSPLPATSSGASTPSQRKVSTERQQNRERDRDRDSKSGSSVTAGSEISPSSARSASHSQKVTAVAYLINQIEPRVFVCAIYVHVNAWKAKKNEVASELTGLANRLRLLHVFGQLRRNH